MPENQITCIGCPLGCRVTLQVTSEGEIKDIVGNQCKQGKKYVATEFKSPVRVLTATLLTEGGHRLLPVRTDRPVPKGQLKELMQFLAKVRVTPPIKMGQIIENDIKGTGANIVATTSL